MSDAKEATAKCDFFVSYNHKDEQWAEWIAWHLEEEGYTVKIQAWDFAAGSNFVLEMQKAAAQTDRTIAVLSPNYLSSNFTPAEWANAFAQDPIGEKRLLIPVRVEQCELHGLLAQIVYIDFTDADADTCRQRLSDGISIARGKPMEEPVFPGSSPPGSDPTSQPTSGPRLGKALDRWREKHAFLHEQLPALSEAAKSFAVRHAIREAEERIDKLVETVGIPSAIEQQRAVNALMPSFPVVGGQRSIVAGTGSTIVIQSASPAETTDRRNLRILLGKVKRFWIDGVLQQSVYNQVLIQLDKKTNTEAVEHPWEKQIQLPGTQRRRIDKSRTMLDIFHDATSALLILGEPGSGKTISLLTLTRELIQRAEMDESCTHPVPVVLNLSSWAWKSLSDWVIDELLAKYQVPQAIGRQWLAANRLLLLLDGLDEVGVERRNACVQAINDSVGSLGFPGLVVSSRVGEYELLSTRLKLNAAVYLQPLDKSQIDAYLASFNGSLASLADALKVDGQLQQLAKSPLMLNIMILAYIGDSSRKVTASVNMKEILDAYVARMLCSRPLVHSAHDTGRTKTWLSKLASKMSTNSLSVFLLEELQPSWLSTTTGVWAYFLISRIAIGTLAGIFALISVLLFNLPDISYSSVTIVVGLVYAGTSGTVLGIAAGLIDLRSYRRPQSSSRRLFVREFQPYFWMLLAWSFLGTYFFSMSADLEFSVTLAATSFFFWCFISALIFVPRNNTALGIDIIPAPRLGVTFKGALIGAGAGLLLGSVAGGTVGILATSSDAGYSRAIKGVFNPGVLTTMFWSIGASFGSIGGAILMGLRNEMSDRPTATNSGIKTALRNAILIAGIGVSCGVPVLVMRALGEVLPFTGLFGILFLMLGLLLGLRVGGRDAIGHYVLRLLLYREGTLPLNTARFLDRATSLVFLRKVGTGYIFIHQLLLDHFAAMGTRKGKRSSANGRVNATPSDI